MSFTIEAGSIINALSGIAYLTGADGEILFAGGLDWQKLPRETGTGPLSCDAVGKNLFAIIQGDELRAAYRSLHEKVIAGNRQIRFNYRCDGPNVERHMQLTMGPVVSGGTVVAVLYHSTLLSSAFRIPLAFLANEKVLERHASDARLPTVTVCAWCADVADDSGEWRRASEYYRRGGAETVQISHGICSTCRTTRFEPLLLD